MLLGLLLRGATASRLASRGELLYARNELWLTRTLGQRVDPKREEGERMKTSEFDRWVGENNIPDSFEYGKGWWDYVELVVGSATSSS
jgi:hypothetical protein